MAKIIGLAEQKQALADIQSMIKEIEVINNFLKTENRSGIYEISFVVENPVARDSSQQPAPVHEEGEHAPDHDVNQDASIEEKKNKKVPKTIKYAAPFMCSDRDVVRRYVLFSRKVKVDKIRELSQKYNISLDSHEENIVRMFEGGM